MVYVVMMYSRWCGIICVVCCSVYWVVVWCMCCGVM